ncbi:aminoglycoside phosphotransferase family protein [Kitasatospora sp. NPDC002040]|uniref:phosphotransferase family protein n=1 Tax=Kitasatospora sp. NPDC002040 TaxID=3154661 RepID=UPI00332044EE
MTWLGLYEQALGAEAAAGYYNRNVGVPTPEGKVNVRIPLAAADAMDVRLWPEEQVLACISPYVGRVPELRHVSEHPRFQVHHFIEGRVLDAFSPRGSSVPAHVLTDIVALLERLVRVPQEKAPALPPDWPVSGDSPGFGRVLSGLTDRIHRKHLAEYREVFAGFGIPEEPLAVVEPLWDGLTSRPFALLHADLHRKNMIVRDATTWFLDWELALWGDPLYEFGIHLHKMDYPLDQRAELTRQWRERLPAESTTGPLADLDLYLAHERIKSAIVDTVRYSQQLGTASPAQHDFLVTRLAGKLNAARPLWGSSPDLTPDRVAAALTPWSER